MRRYAAFTLIELLVVISIIALLIAILLPALGKARQTAMDAACLSNQKQNATALYAYAVDNDGFMPRCNAQVNIAQGVYAVYRDAIAKDPKDERYVGHGLLVYHSYLNTAETFYCPRNADPTTQYEKQSPTNSGGGWPSADMPHKGGLPTGQDTVQTHYHYRSFRDEKTNTWRPVRLDTEMGSDTAMMADNFTSPPRGVDTHHGDGYNVAYADGHARFIKDTGFQIRDYNGGSPYHVGPNGYMKQHEVWRDLMSESAN